MYHRTFIIFMLDSTFDYIQYFRYWQKQYWCWHIYVFMIITRNKTMRCWSEHVYSTQIPHRNPLCTIKHSQCACLYQHLIINSIFQILTTLLILINLCVFVVITLNKMMRYWSKLIYLTKMPHSNPSCIIVTSIEHS